MFRILSLLAVLVSFGIAEANQNQAESLANWMRPILGSYSMLGDDQCKSFEIRESRNNEYSILYSDKKIDLPSTIFYPGFPGKQKYFSITDTEFQVSGETGGGMFESVAPTFIKAVKLVKNSSGELIEIEMYSRIAWTFNQRHVRCRRQ